MIFADIAVIFDPSAKMLKTYQRIGERMEGVVFRGIDFVKIDFICGVLRFRWKFPGRCVTAEGVLPEALKCALNIYPGPQSGTHRWQVSQISLTIMPIKRRCCYNGDRLGSFRRSHKSNRQFCPGLYPAINSDRVAPRPRCGKIMDTWGYFMGPRFSKDIALGKY